MLLGRNCVTNIKHKAINLHVENLPYAPFVATNVPFQCILYILGSENSFPYDLTVGLPLLFSWFKKELSFNSLS